MTYTTRFNGISQSSKVTQDTFAAYVDLAEKQLKLLKASKAHSLNEKKQVAIKGSEKFKTDIERQINSLDASIMNKSTDINSAKKLALKPDIDDSALAVIATSFRTNPIGAMDALNEKNSLAALSLFPSMVKGIDAEKLQKANARFIATHHTHIQAGDDEIIADRKLLDSMKRMNDSLAKQYEQFTSVDIPELS